MRTSQFLVATMKETPSDAEVVSHQLMLRAGMIRRLAAGVYSWLPTGMRVLNKVANIIRDEMNASGAMEVLMPAVQPAELWRESGRWDDYGPELLRMRDRHDREFCFGPTHEEVITTILRGEVRSYRQLPGNYYQIQTKFRDEIRPRFGVMRGREFIMKDAYSFDCDPDGMAESYRIMYDTYHRIFRRLGLDSRSVVADSGAIGGAVSEEFHVLADSGEDAIALCEETGYAANVEKVDLPEPVAERRPPGEAMEHVDTPGQHTIEALCGFLNVDASNTLKTLFVRGEKGPLAVILRGDHELNIVKAEAIPGIIKPVTFASATEIRDVTGADPGSVGPVGLSVPVYADYDAAMLSDFVAGANENDKHAIHVHWGRDTPEPIAMDLRKAVEGDPCPDNPRHGITIRRGIEVGHIFQLGTKYSEALGANYLDEAGSKKPMYMGCYGIGVTRVVAAAIEQNHDSRGIVWPQAIAPFDVCIVPIGYRKSEDVAREADRIHDELQKLGVEVLLDDRDERPGVMFAEMDLIGIPLRIVVGDRGLSNGKVEFKHRNQDDSEDLALDTVVAHVAGLCETE